MTDIAIPTLTKEQVQKALIVLQAEGVDECVIPTQTGAFKFTKLKR